MRAGDLILLSRAASPQFVKPIGFRVIRDEWSEEGGQNVRTLKDAYQAGHMSEIDMIRAKGAAA